MRQRQAATSQGDFQGGSTMGQVCRGIQRGGATAVVSVMVWWSGSYLRTFPLFLPPPQPPLHSTGLSRKEMRSLPDGADVVCLGDGRFSPECHTEKRQFSAMEEMFSCILFLIFPITISLCRLVLIWPRKYKTHFLDTQRQSKSNFFYTWFC